MKCPKCKNSIERPDTKCVYCGFVFPADIYDKINFYFELKNDVYRISYLQKDLSNRLDTLTPKIQKYKNFLEDDLKILEEKVQEEKKHIEQEKITNTKASKEEIKQSNKQIAQPNIQKTASTEAPKDKSNLEINIGQKWLLIVGIISVVFGTGYFLKYSFDQGWVVPSARIAMSYCLGFIFLFAGNHFFKKQFFNFGLYLMGGGIAVHYFSTFAAFQIYHLFSQTFAFFLMILITAASCSLALFHNTKWIAVLSLIGGFLAPLLLSINDSMYIPLMCYMTILNIGILSIAFYKKWDLLNKLGFIFTYLLYSIWFDNYYVPSKFWSSILFLNLFYLIYAIAPFACQFLRTNSKKLKGYLIIPANSFIALGFNYAMIKDRFSIEWLGLVTFLYAIVFLLMVLYLYKQNKQEDEACISLMGYTALFATITIPLVFSGQWITVLFAVQSISLTWIGIKLKRTSLIQRAYLLINITIIKFLFYDYSSCFNFNMLEFYFKKSYGQMIIGRYITSITLLCSIYQLASICKSNSLQLLSKHRKDSTVFLTILGIILFIVLNLETSGFFYEFVPKARFASISVLWGVFSLTLMSIGFLKNNYSMRKVSLSLFFITILKVFLSDISKVSTPFRILSFIILGALMVTSSYFYYKYKDKLLKK